MATGEMKAIVTAQMRRRRTRMIKTWIVTPSHFTQLQWKRLRARERSQSLCAIDPNAPSTCDGAMQM